MTCMASRIYLAPHLSTEDLERRYKSTLNGIERRHLQIIWLLRAYPDCSQQPEHEGKLTGSRTSWSRV